MTIRILYARGRIVGPKHLTPSGGLGSLNNLTVNFTSAILHCIKVVHSFNLPLQYQSPIYYPESDWLTLNDVTQTMVCFITMHHHRNRLPPSIRTVSGIITVNYSLKCVFNLNNYVLCNLVNFPGNVWDILPQKSTKRNVASAEEVLKS